MAIKPGDRVAVFRTGGGLYVSAEGRAGKVCALRFNPYMAVRHGLEPARLFELVFTRYGTRSVPVEPVDVRSGTHLSIRPDDGGRGVLTSLIQEVYVGTCVSGLEGDGDFLVFDSSRASLVSGGDVERSVPLLREGWRGAPEPLWTARGGVPATVVRIDVAKTSLGQTPRREGNAPGWAVFLDELSGAFRRIGAKMTGAWCAVDGGLALGLEGVPPLDGEKGKAVLTLAHRAERTAKTICVQCGRVAVVTKVAGPRGELFSLPLCQEHALERWSKEAQEFPVPQWAHLPPHVDTDTIRADPGWWEIVSNMIKQVEQHAPIREIGVAQTNGDLTVQLLYGPSLTSDAEAQLTQIAANAKDTAAVTCEHCGKPGARTTTPWIHICCGERPVA